MVNANVSILEEFSSIIRIVSADSDLRKGFISKPEFFCRDRKLRFDTVSFIVLNLLKKSLNVELLSFFEKFEYNNVKPCSKSAFCQQRQKIKSSWFSFLLEYLSSIYYAHSNVIERWKGYRLLSIDGSTSFLMNSKKVKEYYHESSNKYCSYPMARYMKMYDVLNGITLKAEMMKMNDSERLVSYRWVGSIPHDAITLFDRGFPSYCMFYLMENSERSKLFVVRCKKTYNKKIQAFLSSNKEDDVVTFYPEEKAIKRLYENGYKVTKETALSLRVVKVKLKSGEDEILITNLMNSTDFTKQDIGELYSKRWKIETDIAKEKNIFQLENYSAHTPNSIEQDFYATFIASNLHQIIAAGCGYKKEERTTKRKYKYKMNTSASIATFKAHLVNLFYSKDIEKLLIYLQHIFTKFFEPVRPNRSFKRLKRTNRRYGKHQTKTNYRNNI